MHEINILNDMGNSRQHMVKHGPKGEGENQLTLTMAALIASEAEPPKAPTTQAARRLLKLGETAAQMAAITEMPQDRRNTGRFPKYMAVGTQKKF